MPAGRSTEQFLLGTGVEPESFVCSECGYSHTRRKNFKRAEDGSLTCNTGHYTTKDEQTKRNRNPYAQRR